MVSLDSIPLKCEVTVPTPAADLHDVISRWSDSSVQLPALVVIPDSEEDIIEAIRYAKGEGLRLIPAGGGHGSFVPIDSNTLYLDLRRFNKVVLDKPAQQVTCGGGALTGQAVKTCTDEGFYTTWPNSNAVGITGSVLGGGNHALAGLHGMAIDNVVSFRLITSEGKVLELSSSSTGEELALFNALCGAGHGLGVVTSITLKIFPLSQLSMANNEVWARRLIFSGAAIDAAANAYAKLQPPAPAQNLVMVFARAPPNSPVPGAPMIILTSSYYGPAVEGEQAAQPLFDEEITGKAIRAETTTTPFARMNDAFEAFNIHGGYKGLSSAWLSTTPPQAIKQAFQRWLEFTGKHEDAKHCAAILGTSNTEKQVAISQTPEGQARYSESRDRGTCMFLLASASKQDTVEPMGAFWKDVKALYRQAQPESDVPRTFTNNMRPDTELGEMHTPDRIKELKRIKKLWDPSGVCWSPYGEASQKQ